MSGLASAIFDAPEKPKPQQQIDPEAEALAAEQAKNAQAAQLTQQQQSAAASGRSSLTNSGTGAAGVTDTKLGAANNSLF